MNYTIDEVKNILASKKSQICNLGISHTVLTVIQDLLEYQHHIGDVTVCSGRNIADGKELYKYRIDGKSILGLYSLDLSTPVKVEIEGDIDEELKSVINKMIA